MLNENSIKISFYYPQILIYFATQQLPETIFIARSSASNRDKVPLSLLV